MEPLFFSDIQLSEILGNDRRSYWQNRTKPPKTKKDVGAYLLSVAAAKWITETKKALEATSITDEDIDSIADIILSDNSVDLSIFVDNMDLFTSKITGAVNQKTLNKIGNLSTQVHEYIIWRIAQIQYKRLGESQ